MGEREEIARTVRDAIERTIYGYDGRLLEGEFWPGKDAIVDAVTDAILSRSGWRETNLDSVRQFHKAFGVPVLTAPAILLPTPHADGGG